jgi:cytochrome b561
MHWRSRNDRYGLVAILLHWWTAFAVLVLFPLGLWMTGLDYYHPWYRSAPEIHRGIGVLLAITVVIRLGWRLWDSRPDPVPGHSLPERRIARLVHGLLYGLLLLTAWAGYLISTADGRPVDVFGLFSVPATIHDITNQEDLAGTAHLVLAIALVSVAGVHALAALKHHLLDRDPTLLRMLGRGPCSDPHHSQGDPP